MGYTGGQREGLAPLVGGWRRIATAGLCVLVSLICGWLLGVGVLRTGTHDLSQIARLSYRMAGSLSVSTIVDTAASVRTSPGRHLPYVTLFALTSPETLAVAQRQAEWLTLGIGFGFVPATAYLAGELYRRGYGPYVLAVDVGLRLLPWSQYTDAQPQYVLAAGFGYLCLAVLFADGLPDLVRGTAIGVTAAAATWVTPVGGLVVTFVAGAVLLVNLQYRALAAAAAAGLVACLPLLAVGGGSGRAFFKFVISTPIYAIIHPEGELSLVALSNRHILIAGLVGLAVGVLSEREILATSGAFICISAFVLSSVYITEMAILVLLPLLIVEFVDVLRTRARRLDNLS